MRMPTRELTHPSWHREEDDPSTSRRESLLGQMVRAQLIFDRRTPPNGMPAWRDEDGEAVPVRISARVGTGAAEFLEGADGNAAVDVANPAAEVAPGQPSFAEELNERLRLAHERVVAEHVHLMQVDSVAGAYLGRPGLRLVK